MIFFQVVSGPVQIEVFAHTAKSAARSILNYNKINSLITVSEVGNVDIDEEIYFDADSLVEENKMKLVV